MELHQVILHRASRDRKDRHSASRKASQVSVRDSIKRDRPASRADSKASANRVDKVFQDQHPASSSLVSRARVSSELLVSNSTVNQALVSQDSHSDSKVSRDSRDSKDSNMVRDSNLVSRGSNLASRGSNMANSLDNLAVSLKGNLVEALKASLADLRASKV